MARPSSDRIPDAVHQFASRGNNVLDVAAYFAPSNASYHPVTGKGNNVYVNANTMEAPWNMTKTIAAFPARVTALGASAAWTNPTSIYLSDNVWASYNATAQATLIARSFGFTATELPRQLLLADHVAGPTM